MIKLKNILRNFRYELTLLCVLLLPFVILYDYHTSLLEYREGVVTEVKTGGKSVRRSGVVRYCNFKISGDTTTYGYYFGVPAFLSSVMGINHKHEITEGNKVSFWFKPDEKRRDELYMEDNDRNIRYKIYSRRRISHNKAYVINIRGLSANDKVILKPQFYNYARKGMYYPMSFTALLILTVPICLVVSRLIKPKKKSRGLD